MRRDADGLVDDNEVVLVVDDLEVGNRDRDDLNGTSLLPFDEDDGTGGHAVGFADLLAVDRDPTRRRDIGDLGPAQSEQLRHASVDARALEAVRDRDRPGLHYASFFAFGRRFPSNPMSNRVSSTNADIPTTMHMSATL